ncbi:BQ2448_7032 [Microbotryum intermedium]|uniref:BQ2448_7032 protein n=1 Tax=Microbotryum intermedium TaxID=269621 RepID=A0A238FIN7_9BASI|nr:BQ2448_7032 [Microbotryum intermedium]
MGKVSKGKQTKAFLKKGLLSGQIKKRHEINAFKQKVKGRQIKRNRSADDEVKVKPGQDDQDSLDEEVGKGNDDDDDDNDDDEMDVEDVLGADGLQTGDQSDDDDDEDDLALEDDDLSDLGSDSDNEAASGSKRSHLADLNALADKDPEFFKYLQENDAELLQFNEDDDEQNDDDDDDEDDEHHDDDDDQKRTKSRGQQVENELNPAPVLTQDILRKWQKSILQVRPRRILLPDKTSLTDHSNLLQTRSIRSLKRLLLAFRSAATTGSHSTSLHGARWEIQSPKVFNNLVIASLKFTPVILSSAVPYKEKDGKYKLATNTKSYALAQRLVKSYFVSLQALLGSVSTSSGIPSIAVNESSKLVPYIVGNRKIARAWAKLLLSLYESSTDEVRIAAFLALRKLALASDHSLRESVLKGVYATFLMSAKTTNVHSLPSLNLMKNAASQLFLIEGKQERELVYQLTFGYVRMLAILLRKAVKDGSKDSFKSVYNWQFVHAFDFWSIVLSSACDLERSPLQTPDSPLRQLLYPLIQVGQGAIRLVPTSRYFPLRFHLVRSLLRIVQKTGVYIPLATSLFQVLDSPELGGTSSTGLAARGLKRSTLKPLDFDLHLQAPSKYARTRVYADGLADEVVHLLGEYSTALSSSIAFPEWSLPCIVRLKRHAKKTRQAKLGSLIKVLVDKMEMNAKWIQGERDKVEFAPMQRDQVERFLLGYEKERTPLGAWMKLQSKVRDRTREMVEKAARRNGIEVEVDGEEEAQDEDE